MSLILDALNRSRSDAEHVPGLATAHVPGERGAGTLRTWLLSGALVVALALIVWLLWERGSRDATTPVAVSQQAVAPAPVAVEPTATGAASPRPAAVAPVPGAAQAAAPAVRGAPLPRIGEPEVPAATDPQGAATASTAAGAGSSAGAASAPPESGPVAAPAVAPASPDPVVPDAASASVAALYRQRELASEEVPTSRAMTTGTLPEGSREAPPEPESMAREEQPIDVEQMLTQAQQELENARLAEHPAPFISTLSQQTKDAIPTLLYSAHDYTGRPADSFVLINGKTLRQGDATKGVRVDEILPDSVVLTFQGTQFRLRALNSWVNL